MNKLSFIDIEKLPIGTWLTYFENKEITLIEKITFITPYELNTRIIDLPFNTFMKAKMG